VALGRIGEEEDEGSRHRQRDRGEAAVRRPVGEDPRKRRQQHPHQRRDGDAVRDLDFAEAAALQPDRIERRDHAAHHEVAEIEERHAEGEAARRRRTGGRRRHFRGSGIGGRTTIARIRPAYRAAPASALVSIVSSILPPERRTTTTRSRAAILPASSAASATAPPGSTTSFSSRNANATAASASLSETTRLPASVSRLRAKPRGPGASASSASATEPAARSLRTISPAASERR